LSESMGLLETTGLTPMMAAIDAMEKAADIKILQCELNDFCGAVVKISGRMSAVGAAIDAGRRIADQMGGKPIHNVIPRSDPLAMAAILSPREYNPLIEQDVVYFPEYQPISSEKTKAMNPDNTSALGLIETQGFTAVFEAIDTACKAARVEVVGKEKLGGGYITVIIRGDLLAVTTAVEAGKNKVEGLGTLIAAHVVARPSPSVRALLPKLP